MSEFNPNITQQIIAKAKEEAPLWRRAWNTAHKQLPTYYYYLVGASITLQTSFPDVKEYVSDRTRHIVIGVATVIVFTDKIRRSKPAEHT